MTRRNSTPAADKANTKASKARKKLDMDELLTQIVVLLSRHSPKELTFSTVARLTKVPRPTLYYYFGNRRESMIQEAIKFGMRAFVRFYKLDDAPNASDWKAFQVQRLTEAADLIQQYPWGPSLYIRYRDSAGEFGESIRRIEEEYCRKIELLWQKFHGDKPTWRAVRISSYLKLGLMWGIASDLALWTSEEGAKARTALIDDMTDFVSRTLEVKY